MNRYRTADRLFRAWSVMVCDGGYGKPITDHDPHVWNGKVVVYGPYFCPGRSDGKVRTTDWTQDGAR